MPRGYGRPGVSKEAKKRRKFISDKGYYPEDEGTSMGAPQTRQVRDSMEAGIKIATKRSHANRKARANPNAQPKRPSKGKKK